MGGEALLCLWLLESLLPEAGGELEDAGGRPVLDDVRTFKVYVDDVDQRVELRQGDRRRAPESAQDRLTSG